jgi:protein phosphatase PTC1
MRGDLVNPDDPAVNARSQEVTIADGKNTHGVSLSPYVASVLTRLIDSLPALQTVNQHPSSSAGAVQAHSGGLSPNAAGAADKDGAGRIPFRVGMSEDRNKRWRRTMEDSHAFVYNFGGVHGQGFFSVFDGHAGKHSAEWCGKHFHEVRFALCGSGRLARSLTHHPPSVLLKSA